MPVSSGEMKTKGGAGLMPVSSGEMKTKGGVGIGNSHASFIR